MTRLRQRDFADRVQLAGAETAVAPVASLFRSEEEEEEEDWLPALPVESLGGGEAEPVGSKRMSDREPGLDGTPEWKGSRLMRSSLCLLCRIKSQKSKLLLQVSRGIAKARAHSSQLSLPQLPTATFQPASI